MNGTTRTSVKLRYFKAYYIGVEAAEVAISQNYKGVARRANASSQADLDPWQAPSGSASMGQIARPKTMQPSRRRVQLRPSAGPAAVPRLRQPYDPRERAYSSRQNPPNANHCPTGMKRIPQPFLTVHFFTDAALPDAWNDTAPLELASGPNFSWHGDFINGWLPEVVENMLFSSSKTEFRAVTGPLAALPSFSAANADPDNDPGEYEDSLKLKRTTASAPLTVTICATSSASPSGLSTASSASSTDNVALTTSTAQNILSISHPHHLLRYPFRQAPPPSQPTARDDHRRETRCNRCCIDEHTDGGSLLAVPPPRWLPTTGWHGLTGIVNCTPSPQRS